MKDEKKKFELVIEQLEERIAPGAKGNNGFGNGGDDPAPGNSGTNAAPNAGEKLDDIVR